MDQSYAIQWLPLGVKWLGSKPHRWEKDIELHFFLSFCSATASRLLQSALCVHDTGLGFLDIKVGKRSGIGWGEESEPELWLSLLVEQGRLKKVEILSPDQCEISRDEIIIFLDIRGDGSKQAFHILFKPFSISFIFYKLVMHFFL